MSVSKVFIQETRFSSRLGNLFVGQPKADNRSVYILICALSVLQYLLFHGSASLHDLSHYIVAGVSMMRDHAGLIYPYSSMNPEGGQTAYGYFQENARLIDLVKPYPSRAYSSLFGLYFETTGSLSFGVAHVISMGAVTAANILVYRIGRAFFTGATLGCFVLSVALTPVLQTVLYPGSDSIGYLASVLILWACVCSRLTPLAIGLLIGVMVHFRVQLIVLLIVAPMLIDAVRSQERKVQRGVLFIAGFVAAYVGGDLVFGAFTAETSKAAGGGFDFYVTHFKGSLSGAVNVSVSALLDRFARNVVALTGVELLYIFFFLGCLCLLFEKAQLQRRLVVAAFVIVSVPLVLYSVDQFSDPHARYYVGAVPYLVLAWFLLVCDREAFGAAVKPQYVAALTLVFVVVGWGRLYGFPISSVFANDVVQSRWNFLDFSGGAECLGANFNGDDLLVTNHALPSGLSRLRRFIPLPTHAEFKEGDNREIDGIAFAYASDPVNRFFEPKDWMTDGVLPGEIRDNRGVVFGKVCEFDSVLKRADGSVESNAKFVVFKNRDLSRVKRRGADSERVFKTEVSLDLVIPRTKSPRFDDRGAWQGDVTYAHAGNAGVVVGPGPSNRNVVRQRFSVVPGERIRVMAVAGSWIQHTSKGRLQVNWLGPDDSFQGVEISVFEAEKTEKAYRRTVVVPQGVVSAVVYATPHRRGDALKFSSLEVFGAR